MSALRIVFMGTPDFAVSSLRILCQNGYNVVGVITATDKYGGRGGKKLIQSAVKTYALEEGLTILQPKNLKAPSFIEELKALRADLQIVVAFRMLPEVVWNMPEHGTYNLHGSLLPRYRGAAPIHWSVINGDTETGVTSFKLKHKIDTGDLLFQEKIPIGKTETTGDIYDKLKELGATVILKTVKAIDAGDIHLLPQDDSLISKAPKLDRENTLIDFRRNTNEVLNQIRGLNPFPLAWTTLDFKETKILKAEKAEDVVYPYFPGTIVSDQKRFLHYCTVDGAISILQLKMQGKKAMDIQSFLNGYQISSLA